MISIAFEILSPKQAKRKKAMGVGLPIAGREAAHGLLIQFEKLERCRADLPSIILPAPPVYLL